MALVAVAAAGRAAARTRHRSCWCFSDQDLPKGGTIPEPPFNPSVAQAGTNGAAGGSFRLGFANTIKRQAFNPTAPKICSIFIHRPLADTFELTVVGRNLNARRYRSRCRPQGLAGGVAAFASAAAARSWCGRPRVDRRMAALR